MPRVHIYERENAFYLKFDRKLLFLWETAYTHPQPIPPLRAYFLTMHNDMCARAECLDESRAYPHTSALRRGAL